MGSDFRTEHGFTDGNVAAMRQAIDSGRCEHMSSCVWHVLLERRYAFWIVQKQVDIPALTTLLLESLRRVPHK